jgi:prepilin-type N-terminal cleavage/methylation domain-containing protein
VTHARGFSYVEVLVAMVLIAVAVPPAMRALHAGFDSVAAQERAAAQAWRAAGMMETLLAEPFASLRAAAAAARSRTTPTEYSDPEGTPDRVLVYLSHYDPDDEDKDGNPFTIADPDADGDRDPYTGSTPHIGMLWLRVEVEGTTLALEALAAE